MEKKLALMRLSAIMAVLMAIVGISALAETAPTYDIVYSTSNPIPEIAANVRPSIVQITNSVESWDPDPRTASVDPYASGSASLLRSASRTSTKLCSERKGMASTACCSSRASSSGPLRRR